MATANEPDSSRRSDRETPNSNALIIAAIDFGTTFTGYAYSFKDKPEKIYTSRWSGKHTFGSQTEKAPTCVLLSPQKEFVAFGYDAEDKYSELIDLEMARDYYFFERFKMKLYRTRNLSLETKIADVHGKEMLALEVFAIVIKYIRDTLENLIAKRSAGLQEDEILWVLTVPAIWSDSAKLFMKMAALKAGISKASIMLVLEPEAGSLYSTTTPLCKIAKSDGTFKFTELPEGHKYIIADIGGGTADLSVHEILADGNLKEIYCSHGDAYGGTMVDKEFFEFMNDVFGERVMKYMTEHNFDKILELRANFEALKIKFKSGAASPIGLTIPTAALNEVVQILDEESIEIKARKAREKYGDHFQIKRDKLFMPSQILEDVFKKPCQGIVDLIKETREEDEVREINTLLLVGGFSESEYLKEMISNSVPGFRIIEVPEASLAVLRGAVLFGHNPKKITQRIASFSYGFCVLRKFVPGKDPEDVKIDINGQSFCREFDKVITKGKPLIDGLVVFGKPSVEKPFGRNGPIFIDVYRSVNKDPKYIAREYGCELNSMLTMLPPPTGWAEPSFLLRGLGAFGAELFAIGFDFATKKSVSATFSLVSHQSSEASHWSDLD